MYSQKGNGVSAKVPLVPFLSRKGTPARRGRLHLFLSALALSACMTCTAGAAHVGTIININEQNGFPYPGDTEAQAQMLHELGLFQGTPMGFQLEKTMTRAEAAVMLTRLLGKEQEALAGTWKHPFEDVPAWAAPYIGWLYQNKLTFGTSAKTYTPDSNITCEQYGLFMNRATGYKDLTIDLVTSPEEREACQKAGFVRGDAVALSARLLTKPEQHDDRWISMAAYLIEQGIFTKDQFTDAAKEVLPYQYEMRQPESATETEEAPERLSLCIAGVVLLQNETFDGEMIPYPYQNQKSFFQSYAGKNHEDGSCSLYVIAPDTLEATLLADFPDTQVNDFSMMGTISNGTDYLYRYNGDRDNYDVVAVKDTSVRQLDLHVQSPSAPQAGHDLYVFANQGGGIGVIDADGERLLQQETEGTQQVRLAGDYLFCQTFSEKQTVLSCMTTDGTVTDSMTIPAQITVSDTATDSYWHQYYGTSIEEIKEDSPQGGYLLWGRAGLYHLDTAAGKGVFTQLSKRAVYDVARDVSDNSLVAIAAAPEKINTLSYKTLPPINTGDMVIRIAPDEAHTETILLPDTPDTGVHLYQISYAKDGAVRVLRGHSMDAERKFEYAVENDRLRPIPGIYPNQTALEAREEQARLDNIYNPDPAIPIDLNPVWH